MKKVFSLLLVAIIVAAVFSLACVSVAASDSDVYVSMNEACDLKVKVDENGYIPTFDAEKKLVVGVKLGATVNDDLFKATTEGYTVTYTNTSGENIGTGTVVNVLNSDKEVVASYPVVAYGDLNGDAVIDVLDVTLCERFSNDNLSSDYGEATFEAARLVNESLVDVNDYSALVNIALGDSTSDKGRKIPIELCEISNPANVTYSGNAFTPDVNVTKDGVSVSSDNYELSYSNNINAGTATVKITGINDYVGSVTKTFTIDKATLDNTINFQSVNYDYTANEVTPAVTMADEVKPFVTFKYNGSETVPSASGIYALSAEIAESDNYTFASETRDLGFVVIAPANTSNYAIKVNNTDKSITVAIKNANASKSTLAGEFEKWLNSAYTLTVGGVDNPSTVASALPNRSFEVYSGQATNLVKTGNDAVLGCYLPEDDVLWNNNAANNTTNVSVTDGDKSLSFNVIFEQDSDTIDTLKTNFFKSQSNSGRAQRTDETRKVANFAKVINGYPAVRVAVRDTSATCYDALKSTGLKEMLVGYDDAVSIQASRTTDFTGKSIESLFEDSGKRLSTYSGIDLRYCIPVIRSVLTGIGITNVPSTTVSFALYKMTNCMDQTGYCKYRCVGDTSGIRYNFVIFIEFRDFDSTYEDARRTLTVGKNVTCQCPSGNYTFMAGNEPIIATAAAGYTLKLTTSSGVDIPIGENGYFLMPYEDATITAVPIS